MTTALGYTAGFHQTCRAVLRRALLLSLCLLFSAAPLYAFSSANIPLDSEIYHYIDKLAGYGLIKGDVKGIKPYSKAEAARLVLEAEQRLAEQDDVSPPLARALISRIRELIPREVMLRQSQDKKIPFADLNPVSSLRMRYVYLDGLPRDYQRQVNDPGGDGIFGIGSWLRPRNPYPTPANQRGTEGTPLLENNNGVINQRGSNGEIRWALEGYITDLVSGVLEPTALVSAHDHRISLNRGYIKIGGGAVELEAGKDEGWYGLGYRGAITLTSNAENFTLLKLSSPEPFAVPYIGDVKYSIIGSRFDKTVVDGLERQPWFYALKLSLKPTDNLEIGFNLGRQVGGPGVDNSIGSILRGLIGGTGKDNSNSLAGVELRYRLAGLRNIELYGEISGEDTGSTWPFVAESYVGGVYVPRLTDDGLNDLRFEFFQGNYILYTNNTFPNGYIYKNMPIGHSQGGATQDYFTRYSHWFSARNTIALEYIFTKRGNFGRMPGQAVERKNAGRIWWTVPIVGDFNAKLMYGIEHINNLNLVGGVQQTNQIALVELTYRY